jgi:hypothetical protein
MTYMGRLNSNLGVILHYLLQLQRCVISKIIRRYFKLSFIMIDVGNLDTKLEGYLKLSLTTVKMCNLDEMLWSYFNYVS